MKFSIKDFTFCAMLRENGRRNEERKSHQMSCENEISIKYHKSLL